MRKNERIMIILLTVITIIAVAWCINYLNKDQKDEINLVNEEFVDKLEDGTRLNTSNKLQETKTFEGMEISNLQLTENNNVTLLLGTITNKSTTKQGGFPVNIKLVDKNGNEIITVVGYIEELKPGESTQLSTSATFDYANAYDFTIRKR